MIKNLEFFYHYYISDDDRGVFWNWWLDELGPLFNRSEAYRLPINVYLTMPTMWKTIYGIPLTLDGGTIPAVLKDKVQEYIAKFYPYLRIKDIRDTGEENIYEGSTLLPLWTYSRQNPGKYVCYFHTKGVMSVGPHTSQWRRELNRSFIGDWKDNYIRLLENPETEVMGWKDAKTDDTVLSGNFFYAKTDYIARLERPYYNDRYQYEKWILSGNPKLDVLVQSHTDHFVEY